MPNGELNPHMHENNTSSIQRQAEQSQISARLRWKDQEEESSVLTNVS